MDLEYKFEVVFLEPAYDFLETLENKTREKVLYNIWKSRSVHDSELFKKIEGEVREFRTIYNRQCIRLFAFWDKELQNGSMVIATHGIFKKTDKVKKSDIEKTESIRRHYYNSK